MKSLDPATGVRSPYAERDPEDPAECLFEENIPPRRMKDLMDGSDTTMIATDISAMDKTSVQC
jgi:hypothetical protein